MPFIPIPAGLIEATLSLRYRAVGAVKEPAVLPDPDELYWMLDGIAGRDGKHIVFEAPEETERFIQVLSVSGGRFDVEWRASSAGDLYRLAAVDILVAHQVLLRCIRDAAGWEAVRADVPAVFGATVVGAEAVVDYAATGLSINNALNDQAKRRKRLGLPARVPPVLRWAGRDVATGDVWHDLAGDIEILVDAAGGPAGYRQGIAISVNRPALSIDDQPGQSEVLLWPGEAGARFVVRADLTGEDLRVTNVHRVGGPTWSRIERWTENAGFWVDADSSDRRTYHANFPEVTPPTFDDLVFSVQVIPRRGGARA